MKYLLIIGLLFFVLWRPLLRLLGRQNGAGASRRSGPASSTTPTAVDDIVPCAHCGLHLPRSDTVGQPDQAARFCSTEHRALGPRPGAG